MGRGGGGKSIEIIAAFEQRDDAAAGMASGGGHDLAGDPGEVGLYKVELRQRVVPMCVEAGRDDDAVGREGVERGEDAAGPGRLENRATAAGGQGRVHDLAGDARFLGGARARIKRVLVAGAEEEIGVVPGDRLRAVAVVHVEIEHGHRCFPQTARA